jgi:hypothetical protein
MVMTLMRMRRMTMGRTTMVMKRTNEDDDDEDN